MRDESKFLKVAKKAALEAGKVLLKHYGHKQKITLKTIDYDFVAQADLDAEKIILKVITQNFPDHNIITEEKGKILKDSEYSWVIDPLDGTITYVANLPFFAVSIALLKQNKLLVGVVNDVLSKDVYWAEKGRGAFVNGKKIRVSNTSSLSNAVFGFDFGKAKYRQIKHDNYFQPLFNKIRYPFSLGGAASSLALVARGQLDGSVTQGYLWDFAGGALIVQEAGGIVTDPYGQEIDWTRDRVEIAASNNLIHNQILEALKGGK